MSAIYPADPDEDLAYSPRPGDTYFWVDYVEQFGYWRIMVRSDGLVWVHNNVWPNYRGPQDREGAEREAQRLNDLLRRDGLYQEG